MNGFMGKVVRACCLAGGLMAVQGCHHYYDVVDPCYPERYRFQAAQSVREHTATQAHNGHVLDQTLWNHHFEPGTANLTAGGIEHLNYLARRRPHPDPMLFLQTAQDVSYDPATPNKLSENRVALDNKRIQAIKTYLDAHTSGRGLHFDVTVHDPSEVGMAAVRQGAAINAMYAGSRGTLQGGGGGGAAGGGGR